MGETSCPRTLPKSRQGRKNRGDATAPACKLAFITVSELLLRTQAYASQTFLTIESYTILALAYLVLSLPLAQIVRIMEKRLTRHV